MICLVCNTDFTSKAHNAKYCSQKCRLKDAWNRRRYDSKFREKQRLSCKEWRDNHPEDARKKDHEKYLKEHNNGVRTWRCIVERCNNPNSDAYKWYGGRGIRCLITQEELMSVFMTTNVCPICGCELTDDRRNVKSGRTVDRINPDSNYELGNIRIICQSCNTLRKRSRIANE